MTESKKLSQEEKVQAVVHCIEHGLDYRRTSEQFQVAYQQIYSWVKKYQKQGEAGLIDHRGKRKSTSELSDEEKGYPICALCVMADISRCSYYKWRKRKESAADQENVAVLEEMIRLYNEVKGIYRLMKSVHMQSVIRRKRKRYAVTETRITAENLLNREFAAESPNQKWLTDITEFKLCNGKKAYLSAILDLADNIFFFSSVYLTGGGSLFKTAVRLSIVFIDVPLSKSFAMGPITKSYLLSRLHSALAISLNSLLRLHRYGTHWPLLRTTGP